MIDVKNLTVYYGSERALDDVSFTIEKNTTCAIIGPSGCGKTTLLYCLAGLLAPLSGNMTVGGQPISGIRLDTALILQDYGLFPWKTVWKNISLGLQVRGLDKAKENQIVESILRELGIEKYKKKYPMELSGGQKQRVAIARSLALKPDLLLMDEPSSALDAITKEHLQNLIVKLYKAHPMTIMMVTHSIEEAVFLGQKIVIMDEGKIKMILDNPHFGDEDLRNKQEFYNICLKVRQYMNSGDQDE
ncbi:MAG: transporter related protein [Clostridia bacterium]|jgi:NitT/TauT family transport system ATP-binding protein|nr:transporter related protein [Clostridia bacterium]